MPRKSRKDTVLNENITKQATSKTTYKTAIYARLSTLNSGKPDGDSIENQIHMLKEFIAQKGDLTLVDTFIDNGETGTNFNRPSFAKMMDAVKSGQINCIVVKDLSRFGRNYIEVGNYLEKIFPFLGVRFISMTDNYDNADPATEGSLTLSLKSLVNDIYAKDISKKVSSSALARQKQGVFIGAHAPYGYMKSETEKGKLVIDPAVAPVIADIFAMKLNSTSNLQIARQLNNKGVPSPSNYRHQLGIVKTDKFASSLWQQQSVKSILSNPVYTGCVSQGKHKRSLASGMPVMRTTADEWINVPDMHEAIIDQVSFEKVQELLKNSKAEYHSKRSFAHLDETENIFRGILVCADCGANLVRYKDVRSRQKNPSVAYYYHCQNYEQGRNSKCKTRKCVREKLLKQVVWEIVKSQLDIQVDLLALAQKLKNSTAYKAKQDEQKSQMAELRASLSRIDGRIASLYNSYADGVIAEDEYAFAKSKYKAEKEVLEDGLEKLQTSKQKEKEQLDVGKWTDIATKFDNTNELTSDILNALISKITVSARDDLTVEFRHKDVYKDLMSQLAKMEVS